MVSATAAKRKTAGEERWIPISALVVIRSLAAGGRAEETAEHKLATLQKSACLLLFLPLEFHLHVAFLRGFPRPRCSSKETIISLSLLLAVQPNATSVSFVPCFYRFWPLTEAFPPDFHFSSESFALANSKPEFESSGVRIKTFSNKFISSRCGQGRRILDLGSHLSTVTHNSLKSSGLGFFLSL